MLIMVAPVPPVAAAAAYLQHREPLCSHSHSYRPQLNLPQREPLRLLGRPEAVESLGHQLLLQPVHLLLG